jgi:beta-lactamase regulating signal transducer with metallopeptidase domain
MIATWMAYSLALSVIVGLAALALERVADLMVKPRRFIWSAAVLASLLVPPLALVLARAPSSGSVATGSVAAPATAATAQAVQSVPLAAPAIALANRIEPGVIALSTPLLLLWCATSLLLALGLVRASVTLRRRARTWSATTVDGTTVLVAPDIGPAVVRWRGLRTVLPAWALEAEPTALTLMLRHEREHCLARDPDLLLGATIALVLAPWNGALWWQVRRLQLAVETDCDARVMRAGADARSYGALLLRVGARHAWQPLLAATPFAEAPSLLRRRIEAMTSQRPKNVMMRAAAATGVAVIAMVGAGMMPHPVAIRPAAARGVNQVAADSRQATCTDTMGVQISVSREAGAVTVADPDLAAVASRLVGDRGYASQVGSAAGSAPTRLDVSLTLKAGSAQARVTLSRAGATGSHGASGQAALQAGAGAAAVGSMLGGVIQLILRDLPLGNCVDWSAFASDLRTPAVMEAVRRHAAAIAALARPQDAGLWLVQDSVGNYISSGVLTSFPTGMSSSNYKTVVPGASAAGEDAIAFGFAHTPVVGGAGPFRLVYVTVARKP